MSFEKLRILIDADTKGAVREIDRLGTSAEKSLGQANSKLDKFANGSLKIGTAMIGASVAVGVGLAKTVGAAQEAEVAQIKLANSVKNSKNVSQSAIVAFNNQALALQRVTVASDEEVNSAQAMLVQFGRTKSEVIKLTPLVIDLARKMGIDTVSAAKAVGKTLDGNAGALKRMGVQVDTTRFSTDRFGATMDALKRAAGGFAEREGKTLTGQLTILRNQFGELEESVGRGVVGVLKDILPAATDAAKGIGSVDDATGGMVGKLATIGTVATGGVGAVLVLAGAVAKVKTAMEESALAANAFKGIGIATGAIAGVVGLIGVVDLLKKAFTDTRTAAEKAADAAKLSTGKLADQFRAAAAESNKMTDAELRQTSVVASANRNLQERLRGLDQNRKYLVEFRGLAENNIGTAQRLYEALKKNPEATKEAGINLGKLGAILKDTTAAQRQANADTEAGTRATQANTRSVEDNAAAVDASVDAINKRRTALLASFSSDIAAQQATKQLGETLKDSKDPLEKQAALLDTAGANAQAMADKLAAAGVDVSSAKVKNDLFRQALQELADKYPQLRGQVDLYAASLANQQLKTQWMLDHPKIAQYVELAFSVTGAGAVNDMLNKLGMIGALLGRAALDDLFRAAGGPVNARQPYIVGEKGPEIFVPNSSGKILNARDSAAKLSAVGSSGGGNVYQINVTTPTVTAETGRVLVEHIRAYERNSGSRWRQN